MVNSYKKKTMKTRKEIKFLKTMNSSLWDLPTSTTMTYFWNFGSMLGLCLVVQISSGLFLTFHYTSFSEESFNSIILIMREIWSGWLIRLIHLNGASLFFVFMYLHLFRGVFYLSAKNKMTWISGVVIMLMLMAISFLGYVLPWGQMSYWAVAVITNLFSVVPLIGDTLVNWIWGGFSVSKPTLMRFYSLHFILPLILSALVILHLNFLHEKGSSNSMGMSSNLDKIPFHPYFTIKDTLFIMFSLIMMVMICMIIPYLTLDPANNIPANPMQTPTHIQPEWYFLTSYAILRAMPNKTLGVLALLFSILIFLTFLSNELNFSMKFSFYRYLMFWTFICSFFVLMKMGAMVAEEPYIQMSMIWSTIYFFSILTLNI